MEKYNNGKIYSIKCNITGQVYYGSTIQTIERRMEQHLNIFKMYVNGIPVSYMTSFKVLTGNNYTFELVENYPCNSKEDLEKREKFYIENYDCVNKVIPSTTCSLEELKERRKIANAKYYQNRRETLNIKTEIKPLLTEEQKKANRKEANKKYYANKKKNTDK